MIWKRWINHFESKIMNVNKNIFMLLITRQINIAQNAPGLKAVLGLPLVLFTHS